jgi:hypothetical protein
MRWPDRGVYFFFEPGETRAGGGAPRVVRVGTHALKTGSNTRLWNRLSGHRGLAASGGGNHRGSIFRLLIGDALLRRECLAVPSWGVGGTLAVAATETGLSRDAIEIAEQPIEQGVSAIVGRMPLLWVAVPDPPGPMSLRGLIERGAIALLSAPSTLAREPASNQWLGRWSSRERVATSGLWNNKHVQQAVDRHFLDAFDRAVDTTVNVETEL